MENMIPIVLFLCIAGVMILRPISKSLARYLDQQTRKQKDDGSDSLNERSLERVTDLLDRLNTRIDLVEERLQFVERLSDGRERERPRLERRG